MNIKSLYPIIITENMDESIAFYRDAFGLAVKHNFGDGRIVVLENEKGLLLELILANKNAPVPLAPGAYGFRVNVDDIEQAKRELEAQGCKILFGPVRTESGINMSLCDGNGVHITVIQHIGKQ